MSLQPVEIIDTAIVADEEPVDNEDLKEQLPLAANASFKVIKPKNYIKPSSSLQPIALIDLETNETPLETSSDSKASQMEDPLAPDGNVIKVEPEDEVEPNISSFLTVEVIELTPKKPSNIENEIGSDETMQEVGDVKKGRRKLTGVQNTQFQNKHDDKQHQKKCSRNVLHTENILRYQLDYSSTRQGDLNQCNTPLQDKEKPHACPHCPYKSRHKHDLKKHVTAVHNKDTSYSCQLCSYKCSRKGHLKRHTTAVHHKEKPHRCPYCNYRFSQKAAVKKHVSAIHNKETPYSCQHCHYKCSRKGNIKRHISAVHYKLTPYCCKFCNYKCSQKGGLNSHISAVHNKETPFSCQYCNYQSNQKGSLKIHLLTHHNKNTPYICQSCNYECNQKEDLEIHICSSQ